MTEPHQEADEASLAKLDVVLVAIDGSELSTYALRVAKAMANAQGAKVVAVHVRHVATGALGAAATAASANTEEFFDAAEEVAREARDSATKVLGDGGVTKWTYEERTGPQVESLVKAVKEHHADLAVVGSHGHGPFYEMVVGSIAQGLILHAPVSVLVARPFRGEGGEGGD